MSSIAVRDIEPEHYQALVDQAKDNKRSVAAEVRDLLAEVARKRRAMALIAELEDMRKKSKWSLPNGMTSLDLLREERDSW